jgi:hypothetical protein
MSGGPDCLDVVCIFARPDGRSRLADGRIALETTARGTWSQPQPAKQWIVSKGGGSAAKDWHRGVRPVLSLCIRGAWEIEAGSGERRVLHTGSVLAVLDTTGQGHRSRVIGPEPCVVVGMELDGEPEQLLREVFGYRESGA